MQNPSLPHTTSNQAFSDIANQSAEHTVALYCKILDYQLRMVCYYAKEFLKRYIRNVTFPEDWAAKLEEIRQYEANTERDMRTLDSSRLKSIYDAQNDQVHDRIMEALNLNSNYKDNKESHGGAVPGMNSPQPSRPPAPELTSRQGHANGFLRARNTRIGFPA